MFRMSNNFLFLCILIGCPAGLGQLISAGSGPAVARNAANLLFYLLNGQSFD